MRPFEAFVATVMLCGRDEMEQPRKACYNFLVLATRFEPMRLTRRIEPFDHPDWIFELKLDGFRALAYLDNGKCDLMSRNRNTFASFRNLAAGIAENFRGTNGILDGEIVSLDSHGRPQFEDLMFRRGELFFVAFDAIFLDGADLRDLPLVERKHRLQAVVPDRRDGSRLRYHSHVERHGRALYKLTCERDLEGIVAKHRNGLYDINKPAWIKIKNPDYSQREGRVELFEELRN
jgi:bifunctional non-homologous end joining protein LigD